MKSQKRSSLQSAARDFPDPPDFPSDFSRSSTDKFRQEYREWWQKLKVLLTQMDAELTNQ